MKQPKHDEHEPIEGCLWSFEQGYAKALDERHCISCGKRSAEFCSKCSNEFVDSVFDAVIKRINTTDIKTAGGRPRFAILILEEIKQEIAKLKEKTK